jgi:PRTRC genetic system protein A
MTTLPSLSALMGHHIATAGEPLSTPAPGITWIWAADGIYKRGVSDEFDIIVPVPGGSTPPVPGLARLLPSITFRWLPGRLPGQLLAGMLTHARRACERDSGLRTLREQQYFVTREAGGTLHARVPSQDATAGHVRYHALRDTPVLLDLHSHHQMAAYFSATDDTDDTGLGVSAVIGRIFDQPEIAVRMCCYGHTHPLPALAIFDSLAGFRDTYGGDHADA